MLHILQTALELGFLYALVAMALFLSFRILNIADMTTDGCFVLGAAVSVTLAAGGHPILAIPAAMLAGSCAGSQSGVTSTAFIGRAPMAKRYCPCAVRAAAQVRIGKSVWVARTDWYCTFSPGVLRRQMWVRISRS